MSAAYSKTPLIKKLGLDNARNIVIISAPKTYTKILTHIPYKTQLPKNEHLLDFIHYFIKSKSELEQVFPDLRKSLDKNGVLWISWIKTSSKNHIDLNENMVREIGLTNGLVDIKVAAIDVKWSGLKFVYRLRDRK